MKQVALGSQGLVVTSQGLGCMGMSTTYGPSDENEALATLARALDLGVTFFDTAEAYGPFMNEALLGKAFKGKRDRVVLATKVGFRYTGDGKLAVDAGGRPVVTGDPTLIRKAVEGSLRRLDTDVIDLVYVHRIDPHTPIEVTIDTLASLVHEGKIRYVGVSEASAATIRRAHAAHPLTAVQMEYSLFERGAERNGVLAATRELGIGFVSYSPLGRGFLTGELKGLDALHSTDFRRFDPRFQGVNLQANLQLVERLGQIAAAKGVKPSQVAIAWAMSAGTVPIPGTRRIKYLEENIASSAITLTADDLADLEQAAPFGAAAGERYSAGMMATLGH
ncbi:MULTISPECIES: aldo/keto reductase [unclassified Rhodanobacter]|uniref:aldo/keto reductase n=1 Tax=unclassified Rhodanobacter TaxID=2621553 RepID=UPI001BDDD2DD|nr:MULTISPECIES: aldo/keto reductase [unclassified Rhodanobacter]MBT2143870.1 aldo/keto reductase [Rhodanobacter sp. LX-99]MBT2147056.1 aldo/keto reductase [Rhodanobacter sp. LX-100]